MHKPRIVFFGTPWIARECLTTLIQLDIELVAIVCQPDRQKDRKNNYIFCDVKNFAIEHNIKLFQPEKVNDIYDELDQLDIDLIITCAFGQFVSERILNLPKYKCVNIHASLLPKLRGGAPIHWAILNQEKSAGVSLMYMAKKMDAGNIIYQTSFSLATNETYDSLLIKLAKQAQTVICEKTLWLCQTDISSTVQDDNLVTFGYNITPEHEILNFNAPASAIDAKIRGLYSKPMAKMVYRDKVYKVHSAIISSIKSSTAPGTINRIDKTGIYISSNDYDIIIKKLQAPNKAASNVSDMINGHHAFIIGQRVN